MGKRRHESNKKVFGNIKSRADETTAHMSTAKGMVSRDGLHQAIGYLSSCGWHPETAMNYLRPDPRDRLHA